MNILISAFACYPPTTDRCTEEDKRMADGEAILGWNLVSQIARSHNVWVITQARNREGINRLLEQQEDRIMNSVCFVYCDFPGWPKIFWRNQITIHFYYYFWQILAYFTAKKLHRHAHFNLAHHITFANDWMPSFIGACLSVPFIWGPIGGGHKTPKALLREFNFSQRVGELFRLSVQWIGRNILISRRLCQKKAKAILVCNYETKYKIPLQWQNKVHLFPVNSISSENLIGFVAESSTDRPFRILSVGWLRPLKGFSLAIKAFAEFQKIFPKSTLEIIGSGKDKLRLNKITHELNMEHKVIFSPWLPRTEVLRRMRTCDVFLFPSFREGGGAVIVEAMANGKPVIGIDAGGPAFHIQPEWGIKIHPKSYDQVVRDLVQALIKLRSDDELRRRLGEAALRRAKDFYILDRLGEYLETIYLEAVS